MFLFTNRFFTKHPDYQNKFKKLQGLSLEEAAVHPKFALHARKFVSVLGEVIEVLDDAEKIRSRLEKLGKFHSSFDVRKFHFQVSGNSKNKPWLYRIRFQPACVVRLTRASSIMVSGYDVTEVKIF